MMTAPTTSSSGLCGPLRNICSKIPTVNAELIQPTILAISVSYVSYLLLLRNYIVIRSPSADVFTYFCCLWALLTSAVFYMRFFINDWKRSIVESIYLIFLSVLILLNISHWVYAKPDADLNTVTRLTFLVCTLSCLISGLS